MRGRPTSSCAPARREPVRLRDRAVPRREQLLVEIEERDDGRTPAPDLGPVQYRFGPDEDVGVADLFGVGVDIEHPQAREQRGQLLPHARHARPQAPAGASLRTRRTPSGDRRRGPNGAMRDTNRTPTRGIGPGG